MSMAIKARMKARTAARTQAMVQISGEIMRSLYNTERIRVAKLAATMDEMHFRCRNAERHPTLSAQNTATMQIYFRCQIMDRSMV